MAEAENHLMAESAGKQIVNTVKEFSNRLFNFIRGKVNSDEDAEDILQDVWYQYSNTSATETIDQISGWLFTVARNKITDKYRRKSPDLIDDFAFDEDEGGTVFSEILFSHDEEPEMVHLRNLFWEELWMALEEIPENQRLVFVQNELEDKTLQEIANQSGENIKTIISRKRYAVQHLRKRLQYLYDDLLKY
jgi:RNA polymerase sigma factor (sigma-70 family)